LRIADMLDENVRYWHKADMPLALTNVYFWGAKRTVTNRRLPISIMKESPDAESPG
jgi:hypothetical protein